MTAGNPAKERTYKLDADMRSEYCFDYDKAKPNRFSRRCATKIGKKKGDSRFLPARRHAELTSGEVLRMLRVLKEWTQKGLANRSGIDVASLKHFENERSDFRKRQAEHLAKAFGVHPSVMRRVSPSRRNRANC